MKRSIWTTLFLWLAVAAFLASLVGLWKGLTIPDTKVETQTLLSYELEGAFSHRAYGFPPTDTSVANPKYFAKLIDSMEMSYTYTFSPNEPVQQVSKDVEISALIEAAGLWDKELVLVPSTPLHEENPTVVFPLDTSRFDEVVKLISSEIGIPTSAPTVTFRATVHTKAQTDQGMLETQFVHPLDLRMNSSTVEWGRGLTLSKRGYYRGL